MREDLKELLESAEEDLKSAKALFELGFTEYPVSTPIKPWKTVESFLLHEKGEYPFIHSIKGLINICAGLDGDFEYLFEIKADKLDKYYTRTRYPLY